MRFNLLKINLEFAFFALNALNADRSPIISTSFQVTAKPMLLVFYNLPHRAS
ncbi:MAG: hypothetical protein ABIR00_02355 [Nitrosospira sp.]|jgi:hypothetical protein